MQMCQMRGVYSDLSEQTKLELDRRNRPVADCLYDLVFAL